MSALIKKVIPQLVIDDIICDNCGISCKGNYDLEYLNITANWGYDSSELDGENWNFYMCKKCSMELIEKFPNLKNKIE